MSNIKVLYIFIGNRYKLCSLFRIISLQDKVSNLKEQIESCLQASTSFPLQIQNENQKKMAPTQNKINNTKMQLDEKTQVSEDK